MRALELIFLSFDLMLRFESLVIALFTELLLLIPPVLNDEDDCMLFTLDKLFAPNDTSSSESSRRDLDI